MIIPSMFSKAVQLVNGTENKLLDLFLFFILTVAITVVFRLLRKFTRYYQKKELEEVRRIEGEDICPICQEILRLVYIETNCRHKYCGFFVF